MKKFLALVLALMFVCCCFAGCGNTEKETIVVGYTIYKPMNYLDESGKLVGFDTELAEAVFGNLGYDVSFKEIQWENKYTDLNSGVIDCIWNGFTCNSKDDDGIARSEKVDFSYNYMENRQVVVVKADSTIAAAADLNGKIGLAEAGSAGESYAKSFEGVTYKSAIKQTDTLLEVNAGTADFAVLDAQLAESYVGKGDYENLKVVEALTSDVEYYAIGFKKGSELTAKVNGELDKLLANGKINEIAVKYGVENTTLKAFNNER
ncbi:MAG: transporter substrate-binding domain-containing protein [Clostridia bacterium]|nr:transporter substrate-binding domain-containing protein [Clostridia bacterium]